MLKLTDPLVLKKISETLGRLRQDDINAKRNQEIYEGQLRPYLEKSLAAEYIGEDSKDGLQRALQRLPDINLIQRVTDKLAQVYSHGVTRTADNEADQALMDFYSDLLYVDHCMSSGDKIFELNKGFSLEPYVCASSKSPKLRLIPTDRFKYLPFTKDDPEYPTVYVKYLGYITRPTGERVDRLNRLIQTAEQQPSKNVRFYQCYTDEEIIIMTEDGSILRDQMAKMGLDGTNPLGTIPFVCVQKDTFELVPLPDTSLYNTTMLINKSIGDGFYALQWQSHSIMWTINANTTGLKVRPNMVWDIQGSKGSGGVTNTPSIGTIQPSVDVNNIIRLADYDLAMFLQTRGIKPGTIGSLTVNNVESGIAKVVEEADASKYIKEAQFNFCQAEHRLWDLIAFLHNEVWLNDPSLELPMKHKFTEGFYPEISFPEPKPIVSEDALLKELKAAMDLGIMSKKRAMKKFYPDMDDDDIEAELAQIAEESAAAIEANPIADPDAMNALPGGELEQEGLQDESEV